MHQRYNVLIALTASIILHLGPLRAQDEGSQVAA